MTRASQVGTRGLAGAMPRQLRTTMVLAAIGIGYTVWAAAWPAAARRSTDEPIQLATLVLVVAACLARPALIGLERLPWAMFGLALTAWLGGDVVNALIAGTGDPVPAVSIADVGYLTAYPLLYGGLVFLIRARAMPTTASVWADGLIVTLGLGSVALALAYQPIAADTGRGTLSIALSIAYPAADVMLFGLIVLSIAVAGFREPTLWLIGAAALCGALGDAAWLLEAADGGAEATGWAGVCWIAAAALVAVAAWQRPVPVRTIRLEGWPVLVLPAVSVLAALTVLVVASQVRLPAVSVAFATAGVLAALARAALTLREMRTASATRHQAVTDELTGLGNRRLLLRDLDRALADPADGRRNALLLLDLDRFKEVNDTLGHPVGDELLRRLGPRLATAVGPGWSLARLGGDEFGILVPAVAGPQEAVQAAGAVLTALTKPFLVDGLTLYVAASIGIAVAPEHGEDSVTLLRCADVAMYEAKRRRSGWAVYQTGADQHTRSRLESAGTLRRSLEAGQLICHYQPQVDLATGAAVGFEALARWQHPRSGLLHPTDFLALAEQTGLMTRLTDVVLATALTECRRWRSAGHPLRVSVNLAAGTLLDAGLVARVEAALARVGLPPAALVVEITEETLLTDAGRARETIAALHEIGVGVSIDDYGVGYSSLSYLRDLPADELKLDRSFITALDTDPRAAAIVRYTVELAHALGVAVVAEGVEDAGTLRVLEQLRCDRVQGHHVARPMEARWVAGWLRDRAQPPVRAAAEGRDGDFTWVPVTLEP